jgi:hypothetical protein
MRVMGRKADHEPAVLGEEAIFSLQRNLDYNMVGVEVAGIGNKRNTASK